MKKILFSSILSTMLTLSSVEAFDEQREGFIISLGAGVSTVNTDVTIGSSSYDDTSFGLATSVKIGYGFSNQFLLYYVNDVSWYSYDEDPNDDMYTSGSTGVGVSYYIDENSPFYLMGAVGFGSFVNFSESEGESGSAFSIGAGYEVSPHILLEATYLGTSIDEDSVELTTGVFRVTANYMWY